MNDKEYIFIQTFKMSNGISTRMKLYSLETALELSQKFNNCDFKDYLYGKIDVKNSAIWKDRTKRVSQMTLSTFEEIFGENPQLPKEFINKNFRKEIKQKYGK